MRSSLECPACQVQVLPSVQGECPACRTRLARAKEPELSNRLFVGEALFTVPWHIRFFFFLRPRLWGEGTYEVFQDGIVFYAFAKDTSIYWQSVVFRLVTLGSWFFFGVYRHHTFNLVNLMPYFFGLFLIGWVFDVMIRRPRPTTAHVYWPMVKAIHAPRDSRSKMFVIRLRSLSRHGWIYFVPDIGTEAFISTILAPSKTSVIRDQ